MGFLSGVLGAVKDDDAVKTYDKHLAPNDLNSVLDTLTKKIGSGRKGLVASVGAVKGWLEGYEREVDEKTTNVLNDLTTLKDTFITSKIDDINRVKHEGLKAMHEAFKASVGDLADSMRSLKHNENGYAALDENLKKKLETPIGKIDGALEVLKKSAGNDFLADQAKRVDDQLVEQEREVLKKIEMKVEELIKTLHMQFWELFNKVGNLDNEKKKQFDNIRDSMNVMRNITETELKHAGKTRSNIAGKFVMLKEKLANLIKVDSNNGDGMSRLRRDVDGIKSAVLQVGEELDQTIKSLRNWIESGYQIVVNLKKTHVAEILEEASGYSGSSKRMIQAVAANIKQQTNILNAQFEGVKKEYEKVITTIKGKDGKGETDGVVFLLKKVRSNINAPEKVEQWNDREHGWDVSNSIEEFRKEINEEIESFFTNIVMKVVEAARSANPKYNQGGGDGVEALRASALSQGELNSLIQKLHTTKNSTGEYKDLAHALENALFWIQKDSSFGAWKIDESNPLVKALTKDLNKQVTEGEDVSKEIGELCNAAAISGMENVQKEVTKVVNQNLDGLNALDDKFEALAKEAKTELQRQSVQITNNLKALSKTFYETGQKIRRSLHVLQTENFEKEINVIHRQLATILEEQLSASSGTIKSLIQGVINVIEELEMLPEDVEKKRQEVDDSLKNLYEELFDKLNVIGLAVANADDALRETIKAINDSLNTALETIQNTVEALRQNLLDATTRAFKEVTAQVREVFAMQKRADLNSLKELVDEQHTEVRGIIADDLANGIKGLLSRLGGNCETFSQIARQNYLIDAFNYLKWYLDELFKYIYGQVYPDVTKLDECKKALDDLCDFFFKSKHFNFTFKKQLGLLQSSLKTFHPTQFKHSNNPILDVIRCALLQLTGELDKAYINSYSGAKQITWDVPFSVKKSKESENVAKVCLTVFEIYFHDLNIVKEGCDAGGEWSEKHICLVSGNKTVNDLGHYLRRSGYGVPTKHKRQDGELQWSENMKGSHIRGLLVGDKDNIYHSDPDAKRALQTIYKGLTNYYRVRHLSPPTSGKHPSSICDMLQWLAGLPYNPVYNELYLTGFSDLFEKSDEKAAESSEASGPLVLEKDPDSLEAYPETITATGLSDTLAVVCAESHSVLTAILGHGHSAGRYACDFNTNEDKFSYPADMITLVCWLIDILRRIQHQLYYLYQQCYYPTDLSGWRDCWYGQGVGGSSFDCNTLQCANHECDQTHNQIADQKHNQIANCGLKSPLQSFLEDGLTGMLPHQLKSERGKLACLVKNHSGGPCKTPMGFSDISVTASHRQTGGHIYVALSTFCGDESSPISKLCAQLYCLLPSAPNTLGDMLAFYYQLLNGWDHRNTDRMAHRETAFKDAVRMANFEDASTNLEIAPMFQSSGHSKHYSTQIQKLNGDLYSLVKCTGDSAMPSYPCGAYLRPHSLDIYSVYSKKHADKYLSWMVYITETFYDLLKQLYNECHARCGGDKPKCRVAKCRTLCCVGNGNRTAAHDAKCNSVVKCASTTYTLCRYGFVFRDRRELNGTDGFRGKRTCKDLCAVLESVINDKEHVGAPLAKLIYVTIPEYIWNIRSKFFWLNVALWSLSLLYLIHIMVIRLDLLHIKSHLHSPSSHRIAAQSLLAAGRVNKLNKVFYLQP